MKLTVGYPVHLGLGAPAVLDVADGTPVRVEGLGVEITVEDRAVQVRALGSMTLAIQPESGNVVSIRTQNRSSMVDADDGDALRWARDHPDGVSPDELKAMDQHVADGHGL